MVLAAAVEIILAMAQQVDNGNELGELTVPAAVEAVVRHIPLGGNGGLYGGGGGGGWSNGGSGAQGIIVVTYIPSGDAAPL